MANIADHTLELGKGSKLAHDVSRSSEGGRGGSGGAASRSSCRGHVTRVVASERGDRFVSEL